MDQQEMKERTTALIGIAEDLAKHAAEPGHFLVSVVELAELLKGETDRFLSDIDFKFLSPSGERWSVDVWHYLRRIRHGWAPMTSALETRANLLAHITREA